MAKSFKTYEDLLLFLQNDKNLIIEDFDMARHILLKTSYFSLISGYKDTFKNPTTGKYIDGTTFHDIYHLYQFDNELRSIFLKYILIAEHSIKSSLAYHFSATYGEKQEEYLSLSHYMVTDSTQKTTYPLINGRYQMGKNDLFSEVIILKYLLDKEDFRNFYYELKNCLKKQDPGEDILALMGFPDNWMSILKLKC